MSNLRSDCLDLVKDRPAGDVWRTHVEALCHQIDLLEEWWQSANRRIQSIREGLEEIVVAHGKDAGVILKSHDSPTHTETIGGVTCQVYDHKYCSELGDALVALHGKCVQEAAGEFSTV